MRIQLLILSIILTATLTAQNNLKIKVVKGDVLTALLVRYDINKPCDVTQFCDLNNIKNKEHLLADQYYTLPISIYPYDGKSIRSTIGITNFEIAKKIENYNNDLLEKKIKPENYKNGKLWVPYHLQEACLKVLNTAEETTTPSVKVFPIFGKEHEEVKLIDRQLSNSIFYLVSGHGGPDPGAIGKYKNNSLCEDEYAYDITLRLAKNLLEHDAMVYIIVRDKDDGIRSENILACDKDEVCWKDQIIPLNQKKRLQQRSDAINELYLTNKAKKKEQYLIVLHIDSQGKNNRADVFFYHHSSSTTGKKLANKLLHTIEEQYQIHQKGRGYSGTVKARNLHMIREPHPTTVYIELGNIKNKQDQKRFVLESNRQSIADWLAKGILKSN